MTDKLARAQMSGVEDGDVIAANAAASVAASSSSVFGGSTRLGGGGPRASIGQQWSSLASGQRTPNSGGVTVLPRNNTGFDYSMPSRGLHAPSSSSSGSISGLPIAPE